LKNSKESLQESVEVRSNFPAIIRNRIETTTEYLHSEQRKDNDEKKEQEEKSGYRTDGIEQRSN